MFPFCFRLAPSIAPTYLEHPAAPAESRARNLVGCALNQTDGSHSWVSRVSCRYRGLGGYSPQGSLVLFGVKAVTVEFRFVDHFHGGFDQDAPHPVDGLKSRHARRSYSMVIVLVGMFEFEDLN